jgi:hypothetical protein
VGRGSGQDVWDEQLDVREMLRAPSRTRWTIISTGMFTSFLFGPSFGLVDLENNGEQPVTGAISHVILSQRDEVHHCPDLERKTFLSQRHAAWRLSSRTTSLRSRLKWRENAD